ncbi:hypothetical protein N9381_07145 [Paracoccaceae bacterium]|nr:hypothetical protein [Paracoccaceae bacterium]
MRLPVDNLSIEVSRLLFTAEADAAASSAEVFVPMESAIKLIPNLRQHFDRCPALVYTSLARDNFVGKLLYHPKVSEPFTDKFYLLILRLSIKIKWYQINCAEA